VYSQSVEVTPLNKIVSIERREYSLPIVTIQWFIGTRCQYDCQYCSPEWHNTTALHWSLTHLKQAWKNLHKANEYRPNTKFVIAISGGEPTMNPDLLPWAMWLRENYKNDIFSISIATNGTQSLSYYCNLSNYVDKITFGVHSEYIIEKKFFQLIEDVDTYTKHNNQCCVNVLIPDEYWHKERTKQYSEYLTKKGIKNKLLGLHDFNPGKKPRPIKMHHRINFDDTHSNT
jgi:molybdenum cofactor biosynthesis enzyme MoaA